MLRISQILAASYLTLLCCFYFTLFLISFIQLKKERGLHQIEPYKSLKSSTFTPPLSILVPAYNEEKGIIPSLLSLLTGSGKLNYPEFEVIVINDGSTDSTVQVVVERFRMSVMQHKVITRRNGLVTQPIKAIYQSQIYPNLFLINKYNGGKADALNAGINFCKFPYFATVDGDTVLETDSFIKLMKSVVENSDQEILAIGGNVLIANGCSI